MNSFFYIEPEVAGELGSDTVMDRSTHPPRIERLHFVFSGWLGDPLVESFPAYVGTDKLQEKLDQIAATGVEFRPARITQSEEFQSLDTSIVLPQFCWFSIVGKAGVDDLGISADSRLVISDRVRSLLESLGTRHALVSVFSGSNDGPR